MEQTQNNQTHSSSSENHKDIRIIELRNLSCLLIMWDVDVRYSNYPKAPQWLRSSIIYIWMNTANQPLVENKGSCSARRDPHIMLGIHDRWVIIPQEIYDVFTCMMNERMDHTHHRLLYSTLTAPAPDPPPITELMWQPMEQVALATYHQWLSRRQIYVMIAIMV